MKEIPNLTMTTTLSGKKRCSGKCKGCKLSVACGKEKPKK